MSAPPDLDPAALVAVVRSAFGLDVESVTFLPAGTAHAFRAQGPGGRSFLKVMPDSPYGKRVTARALAEVPLLRALRSSGVLPHVPVPLPMQDGGWVAALGGFRVFAYEWIDAVNTGDSWNRALPELAALLGRLHGASAMLRREVPELPMPPEDFQLPFEADLVASLDTLRELPETARPALTALRDLLLPHADTVQHVLELARARSRFASSGSPALVVCHTDAHGGNVMRDPTGSLWVIDWETARLAPPEHDLWMLGARLPELLPAYLRGLGHSFTPDAELLAFYVLRRPLEDIAEDLRWMLVEDTGSAQDDHALHLIRTYSLPALLGAAADAAAVQLRWNEP